MTRSRSSPLSSTPCALSTRRWLAFLIVSGLVLLIFGRSIFFGWVPYDDAVAVRGNSLLQMPWSLGKIKLMLTERPVANWMPATWFMQSLEKSIFGDNAMGYHAVSVVSFIIAAMLWLRAFAGKIGAWTPVLAGVLVWALHPARVESVSWISSQKDIFNLVAIGAFACLYWSRKGGWHSVLAFVFYVVALLFKQTSFPLIAAVFFVDLAMSRHHRAERMSWLGTWCIHRLHYVAVSAAAIVAVVWANRANPTTAETIGEFTMVEQLVRGLGGLGGYVAQTLWPVDLVPDPSYPSSAGGFVLLGVLTLLAAIGAAVWVFSKGGAGRGLVAAGWCWFVICLLPFSGFVPSALEFSTPRLTLIAHLGLIPMVAAAVSALGGREKPVRSLGFAVAGIVVANLAIQSLGQQRLWQSESKFFARLVQRDAEHYRGQVNLIMIDHREGRHEHAIERAAWVTSFRPRSVVGWFQAIAGAGYMGDHKRAIKLADLAKESVADTTSIEYLRGLSLRELGEKAEALAAFQLVVAQQPSHMQALAEIARIYFENEMTIDARATVERGLEYGVTPDLLIVAAQIEKREGNEAGFKEVVQLLESRWANDEKVAAFLNALAE